MAAPTIQKPKATPKTVGAPTVETEAKKPAAKKTKAKGIANVATDGIDAAKTLAVHSVKKTTAIGELTAPVSSDIRSTFPLDDLGQIQTTGRWAQGFRLDSGSLRLMWMTARRTEAQDGTRGFELFFQAHGAAIDKYRARLEEQGAKAGTYNFDATEVDTSQGDGKAVLKKTGGTWSPGGKAISLSQEGKWSVDFVAAEPEALKGAFRLRVFGDDAAATKALQEVVNKLGMQALFSPPAPNALEKFKLFRLLWQVAPGAADHLRWRSLDDVKDKLGETLESAGFDAQSTERVAIAKADLSDAAISKQVRLAELLFSRSPKAFLEWAKTDSYTQNGILPGSYDYGLTGALNTAGVTTDGPEYKAAIDKGAPDEESGRALLELGLLAKKSPAKVEELLGRDVEQLKVDQLKKALTAAGVDASGDRLKNLRFEEVYPGYFTVVDPSLPETLKEAGARYLYSTSDNPERVWQQLTGGQKASLTRFQEGILIQGKSSSSDFGTGGAFSVFTRLVTESAIQKAKSGDGGSSYSYNYESKFNDWGGSRPYKLILNRRLLERLDWYGYNGDNYGRSTGLTDQNKAEKLVKTINDNYSSSNELMFPVGNDSAYVDFVVCNTAQQKTDLIAMLESKGITEFNGKPLDKFIRVEEKFFEHPDDMTLSQAVKDSIYQNGFADAMKKADEAARAAAEPVIDAAAQEAAKKAALEQGKAHAKSYVEYYTKTPAHQAATQAVNEAGELKAQLGLDQAKEAVEAAAKEAAKVSAKNYLGAIENYYTYSITSSVQSTIYSKIYPELANIAQPAAEKAAKESGLLDATDDASQAKLNQLVTDAVKAAIMARIEEVVASDAEPAAQTAVDQLITQQKSSAAWTIQSEASKAAIAAAHDAVSPEALAELQKLAFEPAKKAAEDQALSQLQQNGVSWISSAVQSAATTAAQQIAQGALEPTASKVAQEAAAEQLAAVIDAARKDFAANYPDKVTPEEEAKVGEAAAKAIDDLAKKITGKIAGEMAPAAAQKYATQAAQDALAEIAQSVSSELGIAQGTVAAKAAVDAVLKSLADQVATSQLASEAATAVADELKDVIRPQLMETALKDVASNTYQSYFGYSTTTYVSAGITAAKAAG